MTAESVVTTSLLGAKTECGKTDHSLLKEGGVKTDHSLLKEGGDKPPGFNEVYGIPTAAVAEP